MSLTFAQISILELGKISICYFIYRIEFKLLLMAQLNLYVFFLYKPLFDI